MSEKEKKPRRNSARKLFTSPKKDKCTFVLTCTGSLFLS